MSTPLRALVLPALALLGLTGCQEKPAAPAPEQQRFVAVEAKPQGDPLAWCDKKFPAEGGPRLALPASVPDRQPAVPTLDPTHWTWLNVWATWCGPCKAEMPMLASWDKQLDAEGKAVDLIYLSVDEDPALLETFWQKNPSMTRVPSARIADIATMEPWMGGYGLGASTAIPIHILAAPGGEVRCIRTGSVSEDDLGTVKAIIDRG